MTPEKLIETWYAATVEDSPDAGLMWALWRLARRHPQWFNPKLTGDPLEMLFVAWTKTQDMASRKLIEAAYSLIKSNPNWLSDPPQPEPEPEPEPLPVADDTLKLLYRHLRANVTQGVAGDVMQMPPSWGELLTAVHEAAFPDGDEDTTDREAAEAAAFAAGAKAQREADAKALHAAGWFHAGNIVGNQPLVTDNDDNDDTDDTDDTTTVISGTEAAKRMEYAKGWDAGYAVGYRDAVLRFAGRGEA